MNIVEQVAAEIAEIPGKPSADVIARVAIEAYQRAIWPGAFVGSKVNHEPRYMPEVRRARAMRLAAFIGHTVEGCLADMDRDEVRSIHESMFEALYESGADVVTDADRALAGLRPRNEYGLTVEELQIIEARRLEAMWAPTIDIFDLASFRKGGS